MFSLVGRWEGYMLNNKGTSFELCDTPAQICLNIEFTLSIQTLKVLYVMKDKVMFV